MKTLALFDFDGTLFTEDTIPFLLRRWKELGYPRHRLAVTYLQIIGGYLRQKWGLFGYSNEQFRHDAMSLFVRLLKGMTAAEVDQYFRHSAEAVRNHLNQNVVNALLEEKRRGHEVVIVSGGFRSLLEYGLEDLPVDGFIGTAVPFRSDGRVDQKAAPQVVTGEEKTRRVRSRYDNESVDWEKSSAYGDSGSDISLLSLVGRPVAVRPDRLLEEHARAMGWETLR